MPRSRLRAPRSMAALVMLTLGLGGAAPTPVLGSSTEGPTVSPPSSTSGAVTLLPRATEVFVTRTNPQRTAGHLVRVDETEIRITSQGPTDVGIPKADVLEVAIARRSATRLGLALMGLLGGTGDLVIWTSASGHRPTLVGVGSALVASGLLLLRAPHVVVYHALAAPPAVPALRDPGWPPARLAGLTLTPAEHDLSTLFQEHRTGSSIVETGQSMWSQVEPSEDETYRTVPTYLAHEVCAARARAVFEGVVVSMRGLPVDDGSFIITASTVRLTRVFRSPTGRTLHVRETVVVGTPGGQLAIDGLTLSATSNIAARIVAGSVYLFFADYRPTSQVFVATEPVFEAVGPTIQPVAPEGLPSVLQNQFANLSTRSAFERLVVAASPCR